MMVAGCAYNNSVSHSAKRELAKPISCATAQQDIQILEAENIDAAVNLARRIEFDVVASGEGRASEAAHQAISSPIIEETNIESQN
jgi:hypothetical protein